MKERRLIVGCAVLRRELGEVLARQDEFDCELKWIKAGYHVVPEKLEERLSEALAPLGERAGEVRIVLGERCLPDLRRVIAPFKSMPSANCLTALLGQERLRTLEEGPAMVVTPAWIREIFFSLDPEFPIWDESDFRMNLGRYERIVVLDAGFDPLTDEETLKAFDLMGKVLETEAITLDRFEGLIMDLLR
ncbi:MAG: DUF1638 domain-containing protein [Deltaproteobacteria bacterium]|nr:DUF1638 domain-containing protein [Deltaproteobacteria bacterium]